MIPLPREQANSETESRRVFAKGWERGAAVLMSAELLFGTTKALEIARECANATTCTLYNGRNGKC